MRNQHRRIQPALIAAGLGILLWSTAASAQGLFGSTNTAGSSRNQTGPTSAGAGGTAGGTAGAAGQGPTVNTDAGTGGVNTQFGSGFVGRSDNAGRFVGNQFVGQQGGGGAAARFNTFGGGRAGNFGGGRGGRGGRGTTGGFRMPGQASRTRTVRPRHRIAFSYTRRSTSSVELALSARLTRLTARRSSLEGVTLAVADGGTVTLSGQVPDPVARRIAANLVRMEPGVRSVTNELTVVVAADGE